MRKSTIVLLLLLLASVIGCNNKHNKAKEKQEHRLVIYRYLREEPGPPIVSAIALINERSYSFKRLSSLSVDSVVIRESGELVNDTALTRILEKISTMNLDLLHNPKCLCTDKTKNSFVVEQGDPKHLVYVDEQALCNPGTPCFDLEQVRDYFIKMRKGT